MIDNSKLIKLSMIEDFLNLIHQSKQLLFNELIIYACDPVLVNRRIRMLSQLAKYESQVLDKIKSFESDDITDYTIEYFKQEIGHVCNRSS